MAQYDAIQGILQRSSGRLFFVNRPGNRTLQGKRNNDPIQGVFFSRKNYYTRPLAARSFREHIYEGVRNSYVTKLDNLTLTQLSRVAKSNREFVRHSGQTRTNFIDMCSYVHGTKQVQREN